MSLFEHGKDQTSSKGGVQTHRLICVIFNKCCTLISGTVVKNPPANAEDARDVSSILESGRSPGVGNDSPLQYSCLGNFMARRPWQAIVHWVARSQK